MTGAVTHTDPTAPCPPRRRRAFRLLAVILIPLILASCARSPATGERIFTGGLSPSEERRIGAEEHPKLVREFGGAFDDEKVTSYIRDVGVRLARTSEMPGLEWSFTVIDSPIVNAFALPGGYIHVTRGLVGLAENEAEMAGVLAHEIGHVTARHSAERYGGSVLANVAGLAGAIFLGRQAADAISTLSNVALRSYSRSQELEADTLGVRYIRRAGYAPSAMASFLEKMQANSRLQAVLRGLPEDTADQFDIMQTHPRTKDRVQEAIAAARNGPANGTLGRESFFAHIDGMRFGDSAEQGYVRGNEFLHPKLKLAFEVPESFRLFNQPNQVVARGPDDTAIVFTAAKTERPMEPASFLTRVWAENARLRDVERVEINGKPAATGLARGRTRGGQRDFRLVAVRWDERLFYRFMFITPPNRTEDYRTAFRRTTHSLRSLGDDEATALKPLRLRIHTVQPGETVASLIERMPYAHFAERRLRVLNGLDADDTVKPGEQVKLVLEGG